MTLTLTRLIVVVAVSKQSKIVIHMIDTCPILFKTRYSRVIDRDFGMGGTRVRWGGIGAGFATKFGGVSNKQEM